MTIPEQSAIDVSNLRFYARLFAENKWEIREIHWGVFHQTLNEIAERIGTAEERNRVLEETLRRVKAGVLLMVPEPQKQGFLEIIAPALEGRQP